MVVVLLAAVVVVAQMEELEQTLFFPQLHRLAAGTALGINKLGETAAQVAVLQAQ